MDDWISCKFEGNWLAAPSRHALVRSFELEMARAAERIAICDKMAMAYRVRYGCEFNVIANAIDIDRFPAPPSRFKTASASRSLTLGHVGRVSGGRVLGFLEILAALNVLTCRGIRTRLELLGVSQRDLPAELRNSPIVHCEPDVSDARVSRLGTEADALLHIESFDPRENSWFRLSLSAKLPLYLALGRPIVAYGPRDLGSIGYVESGGCGVVVAEQGLDALVLALQQLIDEPTLREQMGRRARKLAEAKHDRARVCAHFGEILSRAAERRAYPNNPMVQ
jgi:glycosyltransferase involved in cell wall biosynthesis